MKIFIGTVSFILGIVGILMEAAGNLPPALDIPALDTILTILGILLVGLGWMDQLEGGRESIIEKVKNFFTKNPYRMLVLNALFAVANQIIDSGLFSGTIVIGAQVFLAIAAVFSFTAGYVKFKLKLFSARNII